MEEGRREMACKGMRNEKEIKRIKNEKRKIKKIEMCMKNVIRAVLNDSCINES